MVLLQKLMLLHDDLLAVQVDITSNQNNQEFGPQAERSDSHTDQTAPELRQELRSKDAESPL